MNSADSTVKYLMESIKDIENRLIPKADSITKETLINLLQSSMSHVIQDLQTRPMNGEMFDTIQMLQSFMEGMGDDSLISIVNPSAMYLAMLNRSKNELQNLVDGKGTTSDCATCDKKEECDLEQLAEEKGALWSGKERSVH